MIIEQEQILSMTGYNNAGSAEKCLKDQGVPILHGKGGRIYTTIDALNAALLGKPLDKQQFEIDD
jgi:hypothetical protein